jgi:hypothetical protein
MDVVDDIQALDVRTTFQASKVLLTAKMVELVLSLTPLVPRV